MRNKFILSVLLLFAATGLIWAQFWKSYDDAERQKIGEAYWLAGKQYQAVGKTDKGADYIALARVIYPELDPATIEDQTLPSAAELLAQGRTTTIGAGAGSLPSAALNSFFLRFASSLVQEDAAHTAGFLDGSVYITAIPAEVTREEAQSALDGFYKEAPLAGMAPSALYDLNSATIARAPQAMQNAWGETYTYTVTAKADLSQYAGFWNARQQFFIHKGAGSWSIFALGQTPPPLAWRPEQTAAPAAAVPAAPVDAEARKAVADDFTACMTALLKKDADGALGYMGENVRFLRLRQTVSRDELKTSLLGYFDSAAFQQAEMADVLDVSTIFVQRADSPIEGITGDVYALNVKAKIDISSSIPFWSTYQKYYFVREGANWVVFAIL